MTTRSGRTRMKSIYADQAATSYPKPPEVIRAMTDFLKYKGGNAGRGSHRLALSAAEEIFACRETAAAFFGSSHPERVVFTMNTTHAINMALRGILKPGDHVLCSDMEHNSVWRTLWLMQQEGTVTFDTFASFSGIAIRTKEMILQDIARKIKPNTRLLVCCHSSNLCSATLPLADIGSLCREHGMLFVVDGAQSAGILPIHMEDMGIDALCVPGHKGLMGPQGTGMLLLGTRISPAPFMVGGNGVDSLSPDMSHEPPEMYEAGTLPAVGIAGLRAGMDFVKSTGLDTIRRHEGMLGSRLMSALVTMPHVTVYAPHHEGGTVLFSVRGHASDRVGQYLDRLGICVRSGFHCAALGHATLNTPPDGAVRASFGYFNTEKECDHIIAAIDRLRK